MEAISSVSETIAATLGVGAGSAQVVTWLMILLFVYVLVQILQVATGGALKVRRSRGNLTLILGQCGAGKTALFFRLRDQVEVQTVSSLKPLRDTFTVKIGEGGEQSVGPIEVVDFPGHQRYRGKSSELLKEARCIVYVVDSEDKQRLKDVAEHFYELLTHQDVLELHTPILIACNKCDLSSARSEKTIIEDIEREIEQMRVSRSATLQGEDQADSYLGIDGEKFKLIEHSPCPIQICRISTKKSELEQVYDFLQQQFS